MKRRNFLQLLGAVTLCSALGVTPIVRASTEDEDRATRLARMAVDHADQLEELRQLNALRLAQLDAEFQWELDELARQHNAYMARHREFTDYAIADFDRWWAQHAHITVAPGAAYMPRQVQRRRK